MEKTEDPSITVERTQNLWTNFLRKYGPKARSARISTALDFDFNRVGGLASAKDELLTYACAATSPRVYGEWGTYPPSGLLLVGRRGSRQAASRQALATRVPRLPLSASTFRALPSTLFKPTARSPSSSKAGPRSLDELPPLTVFFDELEFSQAEELGLLRPDLPIGPIMDFLLELIDRTIAAPQHLVIAATSHPTRCVEPS